MAIVKFGPNIPVRMAFTYDTGKSTEGTYGEQFFRKTIEGDSVYLTPFVERRLIDMRYRAKEEVVICKCVNGKTISWDVARVGEDSQETQARADNTRRANTPPAPTRSAAPSNGTAARLGTPTTVMQNCLRTAVDLAIDALEYAKGKNHVFVLEFETIQRIAVSLYIDNSKGAHIRQMHDLQTERNTGSDAEFAKAGSQVAADAVAKRKLAEMALPEEPEWVKAQLAGEDLSFLGEAPVA